MPNIVAVAVNEIDNFTKMVASQLNAISISGGCDWCIHFCWYCLLKTVVVWQQQKKTKVKVTAYFYQHRFVFITDALPCIFRCEVKYIHKILWQYLTLKRNNIEMQSKRCKIEQNADESSSSAFGGLENGDNETTTMECNDAAENSDLQSTQTQTRWTPESTRIMLQLRFERQLDFQQRIRQKKELWSEIATEMRRQGLGDFSLTAEACDLKYRNMLQTYKKNRLKEDSGMQSLIAWEYYELFKEALTAAEEMDVSQEGSERVVPSLLCESVCEVQNDDEFGIAKSEAEFKITVVESARNASSLKSAIDVDTEDVKASSNIIPTTINSRKRHKRAAVKSEMDSPPPPVYHLRTPKSNIPEDLDSVEVSKPESFIHATSKEMPQHSVSTKPDTSARSLRKRICPSSATTIPIENVKASTPTDIDALNEVTVKSIQNEPVISSSTSAASVPIPTIMQPPPPLLQSQPQPQMSLGAVPAVSQTPITILHPNHLQAIPIGLAPSEMRECQVFGESIGLQLAHVREPNVRAMVQFKVQELLYLARTGKLLESVRM